MNEAQTRTGMLLGLSAWAMWGFFPLYWHYLAPAGALEVLAHRVLWSMATIAIVVAVMRRWSRLRATLADRRLLLLLALASVLITVNWGMFIWGVTHEHVLESSLGYFINPLVSVLLGVVVLGERMRRMQWVAIGVATFAVLGLTVDYGRPPWVAFILAFSFALYGLAKKKANAGAVESLVVETLLISPVALGYVFFLVATGASTFSGNGPSHVVLLVGTGVITVLPLLCFGGAATRIPLSTLGLMQYLTPSVQFILGLVVFDEPMPTLRWVGFGLIWVALLLFSVDVVRRRRHARSEAVTASVP